MQQYLQQDIQFLPGVGPKRADLLREELNISTVEDLLTYYPYRYVDRSRFYQISEISADMPYIQIKGKIRSYASIGKGRGKRLVADFADESGQLELVWFRGAKWIPENYPVGKELVVFGRPSLYQHKLNVVHPELEDPEKKHAVSSRLQAVYSTTEKLKDHYLTSKAISKLMANLIKGLPKKFEETLPAWLLQKLKLVTLDTAMRQIHFPDAADQYQKATLRLKFEELFYIQLNILQSKTERNKRFRGNVFETVGDSFNTFYSEHLPFQLTGAQKKVM
jgi:ATP-dependent DNA helicase RecG